MIFLPRRPLETAVAFVIAGLLLRLLLRQLWPMSEPSNLPSLNFLLSKRRDQIQLKPPALDPGALTPEVSKIRQILSMT